MGGGGEIAGEEGSVADLGEWGVIAALKARMPAGALTSVGIGDDAAVVATPSGSVVAAVDLLIEGRHFRREWSSAYDVGVKAAARSLADIAAMGAVNTALLVALAAPGTLPARWAADLAAGLAFEATRAGAGVVGGDTARADASHLSVTALGDLAGPPPGAPLRRAAGRRGRRGGPARPRGGRPRAAHRGRRPAPAAASSPEARRARRRPVAPRAAVRRGPRGGAPRRDRDDRRQRRPARRPRPRGRRERRPRRRPHLKARPRYRAARSRGIAAGFRRVIPNEGGLLPASHSPGGRQGRNAGCSPRRAPGLPGRRRRTGSRRWPWSGC